MRVRTCVCVGLFPHTYVCSAQDCRVFVLIRISFGTRIFSFCFLFTGIENEMEWKCSRVIPGFTCNVQNPLYPYKHTGFFKEEVEAIFKRNKKSLPKIAIFI